MFYYEVYIDQLFLENLVILVFLFQIWEKLGMVSLSWKGIWINSVMGAAAVCAVIFFRLDWGWSILWVITGCLAFKIKRKKKVCSIKETGWLVIVFLGSAAFYCGIFQLIFSIWKPPVLLAAVLAYMALEILIEKQKKQMVLGEYRIRVWLEDQGERWELTGLIDTGNHLTEPLSGRPVSILYWEMAEQLPRFQKILEEENGYLYIPFHSVGKEHGWMRGMVIDALRMEYRGEVVRICHPVVAVSREHLSGRDEYQMILHPVQVKNAKEI